MAQKCRFLAGFTLPDDPSDPAQKVTIALSGVEGQPQPPATIECDCYMAAMGRYPNTGKKNLTLYYTLYYTLYFILYFMLYTIATRRTLIKMRSFDQDRLGTNIGKALKEQMRFLTCSHAGTRLCKRDAQGADETS
jgi:hypothetical protein